MAPLWHLGYTKGRATTLVSDWVSTESSVSEPESAEESVLLQRGDLRRLQCPVRRETMPLEAAFALAIGLLLRHVIQHRELLDLRSRWSPATSHSRALNIQQVVPKGMLPLPFQYGPRGPPVLRP